MSETEQPRPPLPPFDSDTAARGCMIFPVGLDPTYGRGIQALATA